MKVAIITDWLVVYAGAERVIEQMIACFPAADIFAVIDFLPPDQRDFLKNKRVRTSFIQKMPGAKRYYRHYLPLMPVAIEQFDLSAYDLVLSSSHAVAKGVITGPHQLHISYVHSPMRYAWDLQAQYLCESNLTHGLKSVLVRYLLHRLRVWDYASGARVDHFLCNSAYIARRIQKVYRRSATVLYPPVALGAFAESAQGTVDAGDFYVTASRLVPYKKIAFLVEAFNAMPDKKLVVIGEGPELKKIKAQAATNVQILGFQPADVLKHYLSAARGFVFAAIEDFGIILAEALACGTPVIAFAQGGAAEIVKTHGQQANGVLYAEQTVPALIQAIQTFEARTFSSEVCRHSVQKFSIENFHQQLRDFVHDALQKHT